MDWKKENAILSQIGLKIEGDPRFASVMRIDNQPQEFSWPTIALRHGQWVVVHSSNTHVLGEPFDAFIERLELLRVLLGELVLLSRKEN